MSARGKKASNSSVMVNRHLGQRLRGRRMLLGLSQAQLAEGLGVTFQQIQKYENGGSQLTPERLVALSRSLGVPVSFFFEGLPEMPATRPPVSDTLPTGSGGMDAQVLALVRNFGRITDDARRRSFLHLVQSIASSDLAGVAHEVC